MNLFCVFRAISRKSRYQHKVHVACEKSMVPLCGGRGRPPATKPKAAWKYTAGPPTCSFCAPIWEREQQNPELPMENL